MNLSLELFSRGVFRSFGAAICCTLRLNLQWQGTKEQQIGVIQ